MFFFSNLFHFIFKYFHPENEETHEEPSRKLSVQQRFQAPFALSKGEGLLT